MGSKTRTALLGTALGISATLLAAAAALAVIHISGFPYCLFAQKCALSTGLTLDEVLQNYRAVMSYLSPFSSGDFTLPTLAFSAGGARHFADCKPIFNAVYMLRALSAVLWGVAIKRRVLSRGVLTVSGAVTLLLPVAIGFGCAVDFDAAFTLFHKIFFQNDLWLFDPKTDPVIDILPQEFFLACAVFAAVVLAAAGAAQLCAARHTES